MNPISPSPVQSLITLLPVVLSAIAIFVSLTTAFFTAYLQYFRKPKVKLYVSKWVRSWMGEHDELVVNIGLTITNSGAQYAVITRISGTLTAIDSGSSTDVQWSKFITYENAGAKGESFKPHGSFAGWADYLVVPNRQAVGNTIQFNSMTPYALAPGKYVLRLSAYSGSRADSPASAMVEVSFQVSAQKAEQLERTKADPENKISKGSVSFGTVEEVRG